MSGLVHRALEWLPPTWREAIERESREWRARCPKCLHEISVWELGGVRYKAAGSPLRKVHCNRCSTSFVGQLYRVRPEVSPARVDAATGDHGEPALRPTPVKAGWGIANGSSPPVAGTGDDRCRLWIDGAGCYLVLMSEAVTIGSPGGAADRPDVALMAAISRRQVQIVRLGEGFTLSSLSKGASVGGASEADRGLLRVGEPFEIGGGVQMRLRVPNPLSQTAVLEVVSGHRTDPRFDGVVLLDQVCVLGAAADSHIRSPLWSTPLILFRRDGGLWSKGIPGLQKNGAAVGQEARLANGDVLTTEDLRMRVEMSCG